LPWILLLLKGVISVASGVLLLSIAKDEGTGDVILLVIAVVYVFILLDFPLTTYRKLEDAS